MIKLLTYSTTYLYPNIQPIMPHLNQNRTTLKNNIKKKQTIAQHIK